ncbi:hypothetical protein HYC85_002009 [Camellia sinensis]|uniref:DUF632 domain-containing protein n=1 Tax=Camellia sinensis TaxID=4442 RepID=A0A7J7I6Z5_CAMSI|nr:hypothetical protein HYC85_002009 [Camellia sinensis]
MFYFHPLFPVSLWLLELACMEYSGNTFLVNGLLKVMSVKLKFNASPLRPHSCLSKGKLKLSSLLSLLIVCFTAVLSSWFLSFVAVKRVKAKNGSLEKDECMNTANLSSILEQLSIWEKKLYKEVKGRGNTKLGRMVGVVGRDDGT